MSDLSFSLLSFLVLVLDASQSLVVESCVGERDEKQLENAEELVRWHHVWLLAEQLQRLLTLYHPQLTFLNSGE